MKERSVLTVIYENICQTSDTPDEFVRLIVAVRFLTLSLLLYSLVSCILVASAGHTGPLIFSTFSMVLFLVIFVLTYRCHAFTAYCVLNACILFWTVINDICFGWNIGVQQFLHVLLVFVFFSRYKREAAKITYAVFLFALRLALFYYCKFHEPYIPIDDVLNNAMQTVNSFFVFLSAGLVAYLFSSSTQEMEGKLIEYNKTLQRQASLDPLTGLYNRRRTMEYLENLLSGVRSEVSVCMCDIDHFKRVNDTYGHDVGDIVLRTLSDTFKNKLPSGTFISRWGGEEFLMIFPQLNRAEAYAALEALRLEIKKLSFDGGAEHFPVSLTYGLVEYDFHSDITALLKAADEKLYAGKEGGRDQIVF